MRTHVLAMTFTVLFLSLAAGPRADACNVCHSKDPGMVRMHEALEYKNCFVCHVPGVLRDKKELPQQRLEDQRCTACHKK